MKDSTKQLKISFRGRNRFAAKLRDGEYVVCFEYNPPAVEQPFKLAMLPGVEMAKFASSEKQIVALVVAERGPPGSCHPLYKVVEHLRQHCSKDMVVVFRGAGCEESAARERLASLISGGVSSIVAVTGPAMPNHPRDPRGRPSASVNGYLSAGRLLRLLGSDYPELFAGARVNPFKYTIDDAWLQYLTMVRKLDGGAQFLLAEIGWDMAKYQELQWFARSRDVDDPVLARLRMVLPNDVENILDHGQPGLVMSREFGSLLQRESAVNAVQAEAAQMQRLALQAAGCLLMGYSGIVLGGIDSPETATTVLSRIRQAREELLDYTSWWDAWTDFHHHIEMAPYPHRYYLFRDLLQRDRRDYDAAETSRNPELLPPCQRADRWRLALVRRLGLDAARGPVSRILRRALCGCPPGRDWRLDRTFGLCAADCPKALEDGPCSGTHEDGICEFGHRPCFYHRVLALANGEHRLADLEAAEAPDEP